MILLTYNICIFVTCLGHNHHYFFAWFNYLRPSQQFFSHVGTGLPRLNQYLVLDTVYRLCWSLGSMRQPYDPQRSTTEPLCSTIII